MIRITIVVVHLLHFFQILLCATRESVERDINRLAVVELTRGPTVLLYEKVRINFIWAEGLCIAAIKHRTDKEGLTEDEHLLLLESIKPGNLFRKDVSIRVLFITKLNDDKSFLANWDSSMISDKQKTNYKINEDDICCEIVGINPSIYVPNSNNWSDIALPYFELFPTEILEGNPGDIISFISFGIGIKDTVKLSISLVPDLDAYVNEGLKQVMLVETYNVISRDTHFNHIKNRLNDPDLKLIQAKSIKKSNLKVECRVKSPMPISTATKAEFKANDQQCTRFLIFRYQG